MYIALLVLGLILSSGIIFAQIKRAGFSAIAYYPVTLFVLYFAVIHFLTPLVKYNSGRFRYQSDYDPSVLVYSAILSIIFLIFAYFVHSIFSKKTRSLLLVNDKIVVNYPRSSIRFTFIFGVVTSIFGAYFAWNDLSTIQISSGSTQDFLTDRHLANDGRSFGRIFVNFLIPSTSALLVTSMLSRNKILPVFLFLAFGSFLVYYANAISSRNTIIVFVLVNLCVYFFFLFRQNKNNISLRLKSTAVLAVVVVSVSLIIISTTIQRYSTADTAFLQERRDAVIFFMLDGAFGNDEAQIWMIENGHPIFFGQTYAAALTNIIPRSFWSNKPLGGGPNLINMIRPGAYVIGQTGNNSLTTGLVVEARMNFGVPGVFLIIFLSAYLANRLARSAIKSSLITRKLMYIIAAVSLVSIFMYSEFLGYFARLGILLFPLWLASLVEERIYARKLRTNRIMI